MGELQVDGIVTRNSDEIKQLRDIGSSKRIAFDASNIITQAPRVSNNRFLL